MLSNDFINLFRQGKYLLLDVRSEAEFLQGHIPGAVNVPLLNNAKREEIGKVYKRKGRQEAVLKGFELVGPLFHDILLKIISLNESNEVLVYCWRGGMRSGIIGWLLTMSGIKNTLLQGGYKAYRRMVLDEFEKNRSVYILGGKTGSGKSELLSMLKSKGQQVVCLESLANHKGSAFGALGMKPQPTQEQFENLLAWELSVCNREQPLWLENESRNIGSVKIPDALFELMRKGPVAEVMVDSNERKSRILKEYGLFPVEALAEKTAKLVKRMGGQNVKAALTHLNNDDKNSWLNLLLDYYDKTC